MKSVRNLLPLIPAVLVALFLFPTVSAQVTTGSVRGLVTDPNGAVVPNARITLTKKSTNNSITTQSSGSGQFEFNNLLVGNDYILTVEAPSFKLLTLTDVKVQLNQINDLPAQLTLGEVGETVTIIQAVLSSLILRRTTCRRALANGK